MRIGFDIRPLLFTRAGIHTYLYHLIVSLSRQEGLELRLFGSSASPYAWKDISEHMSETTVRLPQLNRWFQAFWQEVLLPRALAQHRVEVFHGARFFLPRSLPCPSVVTVHDCAFKRFAGLVTRSVARSFDAQVSYAVKKSSKIIVPSETTRRDLVDLYRVRPEKVAVIHEAADQRFSVRPDGSCLQGVCSKYGIDRPFLLCVSTIEPRKNLSRLLQAYQRSGLAGECKLVVCGAKGWLYQDVFEQLRRSQLTGRVIFTGFVSNEELSCLYHGCEAFVFVSQYEGFGLPVLEAMMSQAPVVASDTSSIRELFAGAFEPVDPLDIDSIAAGIKRVLADQGLRTRLREQGILKAGQFSWDKAARETSAVYAGIAHRP